MILILQVIFLNSQFCDNELVPVCQLILLVTLRTFSDEVFDHCLVTFQSNITLKAFSVQIFQG
jgi:hypothetical protein